MNKTTAEYARALADKIAYNAPFVKEANNEHNGTFCCLSKIADVYTIDYDDGGDITIQKYTGFEWNTIWDGRWDPETDMTKFIEHIWYGYTGDQLIEKKDEGDEDEDDENELTDKD